MCNIFYSSACPSKSLTGIHVLKLYFFLLECEIYRNLTSQRRSQSAPGGPWCDQVMIYTPYWYRFAGEAGTQIATSCVPQDRCHTVSPGWMDGAHPSVQDGVVMRTVCFHRLGECCRWETTIRVRKCEGFYVYQLHYPPMCKMGYCGNSGGNICIPKSLHFKIGFDWLKEVQGLIVSWLDHDGVVSLYSDWMSDFLHCDRLWRWRHFRYVTFPWHFKIAQQLLITFCGKNLENNFICWSKVVVNSLRTRLVS